MLCNWTSLLHLSMFCFVSVCSEQVFCKSHEPSEFFWGRGSWRCRSGEQQALRAASLLAQEGYQHPPLLTHGFSLFLTLLFLSVGSDTHPFILKGWKGQKWKNKKKSPCIFQFTSRICEVGLCNLCINPIPTTKFLSFCCSSDAEVLCFLSETVQAAFVPCSHACFPHSLRTCTANTTLCPDL